MNRREAFEYLCRQEDAGRFSPEVNLEEWLEIFGLDYDEIDEVVECARDLNNPPTANSIARALRSELSGEDLVGFAEHLQAS